MKFNYCKINPDTATKKELEKEINRLNHLMHDYDNTQMALKIFINSAYGAIGNQYFQCYNPDVAEAVTLQGQDMIKYAKAHVNKYFKDYWHKDKKLHDKIGITVIGKVLNDVVIYGDTDSCLGSTLININDDIKLRVDLLWKEFSKLNGFTIDSFGHEIVDNPEFDVLNYTEDNEIKQVPVSKIIRHKVTKAKWKLKTKLGKEITITNDHSLIVFRNGEKLEVKPQEIEKTDKILVIKGI